jgi:hypothetical protein
MIKIIPIYPEIKTKHVNMINTQWKHSQLLYFYGGCSYSKNVLKDLNN